MLLPLLLLLPRPLAAAVPTPSAYEPSELVQAGLHVLKYYVSPRHNALAIMELSGADEVLQYHRQATSYLLQQLGERVAVQLLQDTPMEDPHDQILFLLDSAQAFHTLRFHFAQSLFDREFNFLILFTWPGGVTKTESSEQTLRDALNDIFATCYSFHVLNAIVLVQQWDGVVRLYGYRLYAPHCEDFLTPQLLNRYQHGRMLDHEGHEQLFRRPMDSFFGCPINVSWYPLPPFVMFNGDYRDPVQIREGWRISGVDGELLKVLAEIFDFRINLLAPCEKTRAELLRSNESYFDCFEQLASSVSSVAIGALSASHLHRDFFSTTTSYHQSALIFVVRVEHVIGAVNQLVQPFCGSVWCALMLSCMLALCLQWAWRRRWGSFEVTRGALHMHTTLLGNPVEAGALPRAGPVRCLIGIWLLLALVQRVAYQGKLYDVFRLPYYPPVPERIADLLNGDYVYLANDYVDYFPENRTLIRGTGLVQRLAELDAAPAGAKLTTSSLLGNLAHYNQQNLQTSRLTAVREHIYLYQLVIYLRRHSILKFHFDRKLKQLQSAGIVSYINRFFERTVFQTPYTRRAPLAMGPIKLEMFCGLYMVCYVMMMVALFVFGLELLSQRVAWLRYYFG
ncbi:hypothetical protein KR222_005674 [Zaprionus bogoriensis]|nr:hypothetical protein KR222_005674 [Zaprionus bogoriensis]